MAKPTRDALEDTRWSAVLARDATQDGVFVYSVRTTGVFCRPSCASRRPRRHNVHFFETTAAAELAGYRACKRCLPTGRSLAEQRTAAVTELCRQIDAADGPLELAELARRAGWSVSHLQRVFKTVTGVTPRAYASARRAARMRDALAKSRSVTDAIYEAGYQSTGRFYEDADALLGMTPSEFRSGGARTEIHFAVGQCSLGAILVAMSSRGVCAISLGDEPAALVRELEDRYPRARLVGGDPRFEGHVAKVVGWIEQPTRGLDLPLDIRGTAFQLRVWEVLRSIPAGCSATYSEVARDIGAPKAARAVAQACAANVLAVAIPCHRVVRHDGSPSGYRWGVERKQALLERERERGSVEAPLR